VADAAPVVGRDLDAVLFDVGGVITLPDPVALGAALAPLGSDATLPDLIRAHYVGMRAHAASTVDGPHGPWLDYIDTYLTEARVPTDARTAAWTAFTRVFGHYAWRFPVVETVTAMAHLHDLAIPLGVVSNANGQIEAVLRNLCLCQVGPGGGVPVEIVVDSGVVGVEKPDPTVFAPAVTLLTGRGIEPGRIGYVGDSLRYDVVGARAAGLVPLLMDPYDLYDGVDLGPGASRIGSVHDLLPVGERPEAHPEDVLEPEGD
jgi:putative hydrolase of the HAD superfamily